MNKDKRYWVGVQQAAETRLKDCRIRLGALDIRRTELINQILQLEQFIKSAAPLTSDRLIEVSDKVGLKTKSFASDTLADACRKILQDDERHLKPVEIRDILEAGNYDLSQHSNPLASIHGVLKRLSESGEAQQVEAGGKTLYRGTPRLTKKRANSKLGKKK